MTYFQSTEYGKVSEMPLLSWCYIIWGCLSWLGCRRLLPALKKWADMLWEGLCEGHKEGGLQEMRLASSWQPVKWRGPHPTTARNWVLPRSWEVGRAARRNIAQSTPWLQPQQSTNQAVLRLLTHGKIINVCCFRLLKLWQFVTQQYKTNTF